MRKLLFIPIILLGFFCVQAQETKLNIPVRQPSPFGYYKIKEFEKLTESSAVTMNESAAVKTESEKNILSSGIECDRNKLLFLIIKDKNEPRSEELNIDETSVETDEADAKANSAQDDSSQVKTEEKFHWKPALIQSGIFLGIQHGYRLNQEKTRREFDGPFFRDWGNSVKNLRGWRDGDRFFTNYVAHPLQGSLTGRIFVNNSDRVKKQEFGKSKKYWESRFKAMTWLAVWSTQFELGAISEATIGNVGLQTKNGYSTMAYVDLVITPIIGTGALIGEDAIDKYILKNWLERKNGGKTKIKILRSILTPTTSFANLLRGKVPWKRDTRPL